MRWLRVPAGRDGAARARLRALRQHNAALVYCAITGYGCSGGRRTGRTRHQLPRHGGVLDQIGERGRPPAISNWQIADLAGGALAAAARICAALVQARVTGRARLSMSR